MTLEGRRVVYALIGERKYRTFYVRIVICRRVSGVILYFVGVSVKLWVIVTLSLSNITSRTKAFTISFRTGYPVYLTKNPVQVTLYLVGVKERVTALFLLLNTEA